MSWRRSYTAMTSEKGKNTYILLIGHLTAPWEDGIILPLNCVTIVNTPF